MEPGEILQSIFGHAHFRPAQEDIVKNVLSGRDTLAILPTGGGKSICYQVPGLAMEGISLIITPLIALMHDQVRQLQARGVKAEAIHSGLSAREIDITLDNCIYGDIKFLYLSPERLSTPLFQARVSRMNVNLVAIDEAHCISQWGYDFRPSYLEIAGVREFLPPDVPFIALTASATPPVKKDIVEHLMLENVKIFQRSFARPNISYAVRREEDKTGKLLEILTNVGGSAIVYVRSRKGTQEIAKTIVQRGIQATFYHAGLTAENRLNRQHEWVSGRMRVMVATNAFGMGIDKADVRVVIHYEIPPDMESYYQEAGRAGRDGNRAYAVLLYQTLDSELMRKQIELQHPTPEYLKKVYQALANYLKLAVGSGLDQSFEFDLTAFSEIYDFESIKAYHAIKRMEEQGLIQLNEGFFNPSRLMFLVDKTELYKYEVAHANYEPFIKALLRLYGGELMSHFSTIEETKIASVLGTSLETVHKTLQQLHLEEVISYDPRKEKPQIVFLQERQDATKLSLNTRRIRERREYAEEKMKIMKAYVENDHQCRSLFISHYFGEEKSHPCGVCDICLERKHQITEEDDKRMREHILEMLTEETQSVESVVAQFGTDEEKKVLEVIRILLDKGKITYTKDWKLSLG